MCVWIIISPKSALTWVLTRLGSPTKPRDTFCVCICDGDVYMCITRGRSDDCIGRVSTGRLSLCGGIDRYQTHCSIQAKRKERTLTFPCSSLVVLTTLSPTSRWSSCVRLWFLKFSRFIPFEWRESTGGRAGEREQRRQIMHVPAPTPFIIHKDPYTHTYSPSRRCPRPARPPASRARRSPCSRDRTVPSPPPQVWPRRSRVVPGE